MPTKTERILGYLPGTFQALPKPTALYSVVDAFGGELLKGENSLAAVMLAHWIDHADRNAGWIDDLARIGALYGLAPRPDESVEEFREHLKRYIRTFLEGTVTVQGILRVSAEALALRIADRYEEMDCWWNRPGGLLTTTLRVGEDAAAMVLGHDRETARGHAGLAARVTGTVDLGAGVDLRQAGLLHLSVDGGPAVEIDLAAGAADAALVSLDEMVAAINTVPGFTAAEHDGRFLTLASATSGAASALAVLDGPRDAAPLVLGLPVRVARGRATAPASVTGGMDLSGGADLTSRRFVRLLVDGTHLWEIDCAGADPAHTTLDEALTAINGACGFPLASHDGCFITLTSPTSGLGSRIEIQAPAAQDAAPLLFGTLPGLTVGAPAAAARIAGLVDLRNGADLSQQAALAIRFDGGAAVTVNCAGANPRQTTLAEVVTAINIALGRPIASHNGRHLILTSPTTGAASELTVAQTGAGDAAQQLLGLKNRTFHGAPAAPATLRGRVDLSGGMDLAARHLLQLAVDDAKPQVVDLRRLAVNRRSVTPSEIAAAINADLGVTVASHDGQALILTSPASGPDSLIGVRPMEKTLQRRFVSRAAIIDEAAAAVFGFVSGEAVGKPAVKARLASETDLSRGVDLRGNRFLRLVVDQLPAVEIDCAGPRPRATTLEQIVAAINAALGKEVAGHDGLHLVLTSPTAGGNSRIALEPPRAQDALALLLNREPGISRGTAAVRVQFTGTVSLTDGIDLPADAAINLAIDGNPPVEIVLTSTPAHKNLNQLGVAINLALVGQVAGHDGVHLTLTSPMTGSTSRIEFALPAGTDVTAALFGIAAPRSYQGEAATAARVLGTSDLGAGVDLRTAANLNVALDGLPPMTIDCAAMSVDAGHATLDEIVTVINSEAGATIAFHDSHYLELVSPTAGSGSRIELLAFSAGNATPVLFGAAGPEAHGSEPAPAVLTGIADLLGPVDLSQRGVLRLTVDDGRPVDIAVAGAAPDRTFGDEIVDAINKVFPSLASLTSDDRLQLQSSVAGETSRVAVRPLRYLEVIEYPAVPRVTTLNLCHAERLTLRNNGAAAVFASAEFTSSAGLAGPALADPAAGWQVRVLVVLAADERLRLWRDPRQGLLAQRWRAGAAPQPVPPGLVRVRSLRPGGAGQALAVPRGRSRWLFQNCLGSRFNHTDFDEGRFTGGLCLDRGIFDVSRFAPAADEPVAAVFAGRAGDNEPAAEVTLRWQEHLPGAFTVHLPADLASRFGGRFNAARFALPAAGAESYPQAVTEPAGDPDYLPNLLNARSNLVRAEVVPVVPLGWSPVAMPFRKPRYLTLGSETQAARIYLAEEGIAGFLAIEAKIPGAAGNAIFIAARKSGPALFDVTVAFAGGRFENARQTVLGAPLPSLTEKLLQPGPVGLLQAKAAGVRGAATRERSERQT